MILHTIVGVKTRTSNRGSGSNNRNRNEAPIREEEDIVAKNDIKTLLI